MASARTKRCVIRTDVSIRRGWRGMDAVPAPNALSLLLPGPGMRAQTNRPEPRAGAPFGARPATSIRSNIPFHVPRREDP